MPSGEDKNFKIGIQAKYENLYSTSDESGKYIASSRKGGEMKHYHIFRKVLFPVTILLLIAGVLATSPAAAANMALDFDGSNDYVTFGTASELGLSQFTIECWFKREGAGNTASTGTGGVTAVPLVTKGRGEADGDNRDMNYFFGIESGTNLLTADSEEGASGTSPGLNHPVTGTTAVATGVWYHAAVTYDGTSWRLYLNGNLDAELSVGQPPRSDSIQHSGIATAMTSTGSAAGYFDGIIDEIRIWNYARTQTDIQNDMTSEITSATGLVGRWGLNEGSGTDAVNSESGGSDGTLINGPAWVEGSPFSFPLVFQQGVDSYAGTVDTFASRLT